MPHHHGCQSDCCWSAAQARFGDGMGDVERTHQAPRCFEEMVLPLDLVDLVVLGHPCVEAVWWK